MTTIRELHTRLSRLNCREKCDAARRALTLFRSLLRRFSYGILLHAQRCNRGHHGQTYNHHQSLVCFGRSSEKTRPASPRSPYWRETKSFPTAGEAKQFAKAMVVRKIGGHSRYVERSPAEAAYDHSFENRSMDRRKGKRVPKIDAAASHFSPLISRARYIYRSGRHGKPDIQ